MAGGPVQTKRPKGGTLTPGQSATADYLGGAAVPMTPNALAIAQGAIAPWQGSGVDKYGGIAPNAGDLGAAGRPFWSDARDTYNNAAAASAPTPTAADLYAQLMAMYGPGADGGYAAGLAAAQHDVSSIYAPQFAAIDKTKAAKKAETARLQAVNRRLTGQAQANAGVDAKTSGAQTAGLDKKSAAEYAASVAQTNAAYNARVADLTKQLTDSGQGNLVATRVADLQKQQLSALDRIKAQGGTLHNALVQDQASNQQYYNAGKEVYGAQGQEAHTSLTNKLVDVLNQLDISKLNLTSQQARDLMNAKNAARSGSIAAKQSGLQNALAIAAAQDKHQLALSTAGKNASQTDLNYYKVGGGTKGGTDSISKMIAAAAGMGSDNMSPDMAKSYVDMINKAVTGGTNSDLQNGTWMDNGKATPSSRERKINAIRIYASNLKLNPDKAQAMYEAGYLPSVK